MNTDTRTPWRDTLETTAGQLVERVSERAFAAASGAEPSRLWRWVLAAIGLFFAWKMLHGLKKVFWAIFGIGMALFWSNAWRIFH